MAGALGAAAIAAGATLLGSGAQMYGNAKLNKKTINYNWDMYERQRVDALQDWNMINSYNSPSEQMKRLEAAGLNPRLVYEGGAGANQGGAVRSSNMEGYKPIPTDYQGMASDLGSVVMGYYDLQMRQAQVDNLKAQNDVAKQDALLRAAQVAATLAGTTKTGVDTKQAEFNLQQAEALKDVSLQAAVEGVRKTQSEIDYTLQKNEREIALAHSSLAQAAEAILKSRQDRELSAEQKRQVEQQIVNLRKDATLKQLDIDLKRLGIQPGDSMWARMLGRIVGDPGKIWDGTLHTGFKGTPEQQEKQRKELLKRLGMEKSGYQRWKEKTFGNIK